MAGGTGRPDEEARRKSVGNEREVKGVGTREKSKSRRVGETKRRKDESETQDNSDESSNTLERLAWFGFGDWNLWIGGWRLGLACGCRWSFVVSRSKTGRTGQELA